MGSKASIAIPPQTGKTIVITGANSGIGWIAARDFATAGAHVVVCARDRKKGNDAIAELQKKVPTGTFELGVLDLADLASVRAFAAGFSSRSVDVLVNNAGVMNPPTRELTKDGFELQLGTNFIGHYVLTILMLPALRRAPAPRVVNVSSIRANHDFFKGPPATIEFVRDPVTYNSEAIYNESKALNLIFNNEMARRCPDILFVACHPGVSATNLFRYKYGWAKAFMQSPEMGAQGTIRAAVDPTAKSGGSYYGPQWRKGPPKELPMPPLTLDPELARKYFAAVEAATGVKLDQASNS